MPFAIVYQPPRRRASWRSHRGCGLALSLCLAVAPWLGHASGTSTRNPDQAANQLSIKIYDDRMTLAMTKAPQVYLYGVIDADAPQRFAELVKSWKIPTGSDIYLNASGGDLNAGMALGKLFRTGSMVTHLGTPTRDKRQGTASKTATCTDACVYAYFGGVYRWAPSGSDRMGFSTTPAPDPKTTGGDRLAQAPADVLAYLKDMGIDPGLLAPTWEVSRGGAAWLNSDQMLATGLANNGRQNLIATYKLANGAPYLELKQTDRNGDHRITLLCKPDGATLTAYNTVGTDRANQIVAHATRSYFEIDQQQTLPLDQDGAKAVDQSVILNRTYPLTELDRVSSAKSMGAWVNTRNNFRYGFAFEIGGVKKVVDAFYTNCRLYAPWPNQNH